MDVVLELTRFALIKTTLPSLTLFVTCELVRAHNIHHISIRIVFVALNCSIFFYQDVEAVFLRLLLFLFLLHFLELVQ